MEKRSIILSMINQIFDAQFMANEQMQESFYVGLADSAFKSIYRELDDINSQFERHQLRNQIVDLILETYNYWQISVLEPLILFLKEKHRKYEQSVLHMKLLIFVD
jgi:hypothetical protein